MACVSFFVGFFSVGMGRSFECGVGGGLLRFFGGEGGLDQGGGCVDMRNEVEQMRQVGKGGVKRESRQGRRADGRGRR